ncbi:MAG: hypothetical protein M0030_13045 [Actinomycetota bacterium]|nr:hypothetical protein [Actinomycetota bacterium]
MAITLTDEHALLYVYLDRKHSFVWDNKVIGQITKIGNRLWRTVQKIAVEQGFEPTHGRVGDAPSSPLTGSKGRHVRTREQDAEEQRRWYEERQARLAARQAEQERIHALDPYNVPKDLPLDDEEFPGSKKRTPEGRTSAEGRARASVNPGPFCVRV